MFGFFKKDSSISPDLKKTRRKWRELTALEVAGERRRKELKEMKHLHSAMRSKMKVLRDLGYDPQSLTKDSKALAEDAKALDKELEDFFNGN